MEYVIMIYNGCDEMKQLEQRRTLSKSHMHQAVYILHLAKAARSDDSVYAKVIAQETTHKNKQKIQYKHE